MNREYHERKMREYAQYLAIKSEGDIKSIEDALCDIDTMSDERMADIENALCELDGGNENE